MEMSFDLNDGHGEQLYDLEASLNEDGMPIVQYMYNLETASYLDVDKLVKKVKNKLYVDIVHIIKQGDNYDQSYDSEIDY